MFGFITRWWRNCGRKIFRYWDGSRTRLGDPQVLFRELANHSTFDWDESNRILYGAHEEHENQQLAEMHKQHWWETEETTVNAIREVFDLRDQEHGGLTNGECLDLLERFENYVFEQKKSIDRLLTSQKPTDPEFSEESTTKPDSDSTSTSNVSASEELLQPSAQ